MAEPHRFRCEAVWTAGDRGPTTNAATYTRDFHVQFEGKPPIPASALPVYAGDPTRPNPEDLLVAALAGCHLLTYLSLCARAGIQVLEYRDTATATMQMKDGAMRFTEATLHPATDPLYGYDLEKAKALHEKANRGCFVANSVNFPVQAEGTITVAED